MAAGLAHKVEIQIAYAIGVADPVSVNVETFGTEQGVTRGQIAAAVRKVFDLRPAAIIDELDLKRPIYLKTAAYGHFGRTDVEFPWEKTDKVEELQGRDCCGVISTSPRRCSADASRKHPSCI